MTETEKGLCRFRELLETMPNSATNCTVENYEQVRAEMRRKFNELGVTGARPQPASPPPPDEW